MQVVFPLHYENTMYHSCCLEEPYYFLPFPGTKRPILHHVMQLLLEDSASVTRFTFVVHEDIWSVAQVRKRLHMCMEEISIPYEIVEAKVKNTQMYLEEHLQEDTPILFIEPTLLYTHLGEFLSNAKEFDVGQVWLDEREVFLMYFGSKNAYMQIGTRKQHVLEYIEEERDSVVCLHDPRAYISYYNASKEPSVFPVEDTYVRSITDTCTLQWKLLPRDMGFCSAEFSIAVVLEGACKTSDGALCPAHTILAGKGMFTTDTFSKLLFLEDQSILDKKPYCALIDQKQAFPSGCIIQKEPPSMLSTDRYEVHIKEKENGISPLHYSTKGDVLLLYEGELEILGKTYLKDTAIFIPESSCYQIRCTAASYVWIRIKETPPKTST